MLLVFNDAHHLHIVNHLCHGLSWVAQMGHGFNQVTRLDAG
jgi:hypothetical protein